MNNTQLSSTFQKWKGNCTLDEIITKHRFKWLKIDGHKMSKTDFSVIIFKKTSIKMNESKIMESSNAWPVMSRPYSPPDIVGFRAAVAHTQPTNGPRFCFFLGHTSRKDFDNVLWKPSIYGFSPFTPRTMWDTTVHSPWGPTSSLAHFQLEIKLWYHSITTPLSTQYCLV